MSTCLTPDCDQPARSYAGHGPRPRYCPEHSSARHRTARSRAGTDTRPDCCKDTGTRGYCAQHRKVKVRNYAKDLSPDSVMSGNDQVAAAVLVAAQSRDVATSGLSVSSPYRAITSQLWFPAARLQVIGSADLTADGKPVNPEWREQFGEFAPDVHALGELLPRGESWPWVDVTSKVFTCEENEER